MKKQFKELFIDQFSFFMAAPALVWEILFCLVPLGIIAVMSLLPSERYLNLYYYARIFNIPHFKIISFSLSLSITTTLLCLLIGYPVAYWLSQKMPAGWRNLFLFLLIVPFWTNLLVLVYSWIFILEKNGIINSLLINLGIVSEPFSILNSRFAIILGTFYCYLPFMILPIYSALEKLDKTILEASADLGATALQTFFKIVVPFSWSGIRTGMLLVFVPVFGEYAIPLLLGGDKYMFVGNAIAHYVFTVLDLSIASAFTIVAGLCLFIGIMVTLYIAKRIIFKL